MTTAAHKAPGLAAFDCAYGRRRSDEPIKADDPQAQEKLAARIKALENIRQAMKDIKAAIRMKAIVTGNERLRDMLMTDTMIQKCRAEGSDLFPAWQLQNLGQNIARLRKRLEDVQAEAARAPAEDVAYDGFTIVENTELGRIQILFDEKPDDGARRILKNEGFRWAPSQDAWQRHLNANGRSAVRRALYRLARAA